MGCLGVIAVLTCQAAGHQQTLVPQDDSVLETHGVFRSLVTRRRLPASRTKPSRSAASKPGLPRPGPKQKKKRSPAQVAAEVARKALIYQNGKAKPNPIVSIIMHKQHHHRSFCG